MTSEHIAWTFAALTFAAWLIEHLGGASARQRLRRQRDAQQDRADTLAYVLDRRVRPESPLELVRGESS